MEEAGNARWLKVCEQIKGLFGVELEEPRFIAERGEITMTYREPSRIRLDLSSSGRGLQQTLLLLVHLAANPGSVLLLDEPDAHLEILRQRQIYQVLSDAAREHGSQIIIASHSEVILNEAADRDVVVAFLGKPHRIDDRGSQLLKSLKTIGFDQHYQAEQKGWVLYLEGSTDLAILRAFAEVLAHPAGSELERPFVHYVQQPSKAREHFRGLREARADLVGIAVLDRGEQPLVDVDQPTIIMWRRREIENYLCTQRTLAAWAEWAGEKYDAGPLFRARWTEAMDESIQEIEGAMRTLSMGSPWSPDTKVSDEFLDRLFPVFFKKLELPNLMNKTRYHELARFVPEGELDPEVAQVLDRIAEAARQATPLEEEQGP
jgi:hypothetical protein